MPTWDFESHQDRYLREWCDWLQIEDKYNRDNFIEFYFGA